VVSQSAAALDAAHAEGLIHGGVRPAVILLEGAEEDPRVFLSDFGIALHVSSSTRLTRTGSFGGTVDYVAPEQIRGESGIDGRADAYALGCVLYRCLVGEPPFPRESELVTIFAHLNDPPPRPSEHRAELPAEIDAVIARSLAKAREDRFDTCEDLASQTQVALGLTAAVPPDRPVEVTAPILPRRSAVLRNAGIVTAALALVAGGALFAKSRGSGGASPSPSPSTSSSSSASPSAETPIVIAAAGEIACPVAPYTTDPDHCRYDLTAELLDPRTLNAVIALGDNQYESGTYNEYHAYYDKWWGTVKTITEPVPGDHEYNRNPSSNAHGYYQYWGTPAYGHDGDGYRSFNLPTRCKPGVGVCWHFIAINSELCLLPTGCGPPSKGAPAAPGNQMYAWLKHDLQTHPNSSYGCTLAFWHHPRFAFSTGSGETPEVKPIWDLLYRAGVDVVLNANSHNYERWDPLGRSGHPDPNGIREFVNGLGGVRKEPLQAGVWPAGLAAGQDTSFGVLEMGLLENGYTWQWLSAPGQPPYTDAQTTPVVCH
jgi:acid phosphatase type 7